jgi:hypothetical protein
MIWYDASGIDPTDPAQVGKVSRELKAQGKWPWNEETR